MMLAGLQKIVKKHSLENVISVKGLAPHCGLSFEGAGSLSYLDINTVYSNVMTENGVLTIGINNISLSHEKEDIEKFLDVSEKAMKAIKTAIEKDSISSFITGGKVDPVFKRNL